MPKFIDVCFRLDRFWGECESRITSLLSEFAEPATWDEEGFNSAEEIIRYSKDYIAELMGSNCFSPIIRDDSVIVMDGPREVLEIYYGFTPVCRQFDGIVEVCIEKKTKESLLGRVPFDPFNAASYPNPKKFYEDYEYGFEDYEDAREYWESVRKASKEDK